MTESQALLSSFHPNWHICLDLTLSNSLVLTLSRIPTLLGVLFLLSLACTIKHDQMTSWSLIWSSQFFLLQNLLLIIAHSPLQ